MTGFLKTMALFVLFLAGSALLALVVPLAAEHESHKWDVAHGYAAK